ncbi:MAG: glycoside hydrolase family 32 protein [Candidatus Promineofilum sp.]|nr:glycoside hydrolase family 32 protein [Promineifilum sp.]
MSSLPEIVFQAGAKPISDPLRPIYHFLPPANWMNDPNGFIQWQGRYHLFYQYNPAGPFHADIHWGHATSADLVRWEHRPLALAPTPGGPDANGCWSGAAVIGGDGTSFEGRPLVFYTGVFPQTVCAALGSDDLDTWAKHPANPLIAAPPPGFGGDSGDFRDPFVWREGNAWWLVISSRVADGGGAVLLYRSADLLAWEYVGPLLVGDAAPDAPLWTGTVWECPNLFPLDGRHVLIVSFQNHDTGELLYAGYAVGDFADGRFSAGPFRPLEYGETLYAPQVTLSEDGRAVLMGWLKEGRDGNAQRAAGWSGVMSLPRLLSLGDDGTLRFRPVPEVAELRGEHVHVAPCHFQPGDANPLAELRGGSLEIEAVLEPDGATAFGLAWYDPLAEGESISLRCDVATGTITLRTLSSPNPIARPWHAAPLPAGPVRLRVFIDRSVVEVFVDDRAVLSGRFYPPEPEAMTVALFAEGGTVQVVGLEAWRMDTIWTT